MKKSSDFPEKLINSVEALGHALTFLGKAKKDPFYFAGISKNFETCLEYAWKHFKRKTIGEGLEVYSPKEAIKHAGRLGLIENVEKWLGFLEDRNLAVHDYLGIDDEDYLKTIQDFYQEINKLIKTDTKQSL